MPPRLANPIMRAVTKGKSIKGGAVKAIPSAKRINKLLETYRF
jgi:hypothetical protein